MGQFEREAASLFAEYLERRENGSAVEFDAFLADHPERGTELRALLSKHVRIERELFGGPTPDALGRGTFFHRSGPSERAGRALAESTSGAPGLGPGSRLGGFQLVGLLGSGGMGRVYEAIELGLGRRVALKVVLPERIDARALELFDREARAGGRLSHPGIVGVHGYGETDGVHWINEELVEGGWTLHDFLGEMRAADSLPEDYDRHVVELTIQLAEALQAAHDAGVIHRDIKPRNILIGPDDRPKIGDFGLARLSGESGLTMTGDFLGTYLYMSPEQVAARRMGLDHRSDIFSLGVVFYELLGLRRPFEGDTTHQIAEKILTWDPPDLHHERSRVPRELAAIAGKMLEKRPRDRYQSMRELADDLRRFLANEPILARPPGALRRAWKWAQRNPTKSLVGGVACSASLIIGGLALRVVRANDELATKEAESSARAEDLLRLSLAQDLADMEADADALWPVTPAAIPRLEAWLEREQRLAREAPRLEARRTELRALALPRTEEQAHAERAASPELGTLEARQAELAARRAALTVRTGNGVRARSEPDWSRFPASPTALGAIAWDLVRPGRAQFGREAEGVALAARAASLLEGDERATALLTQAEGLFALGDDAAALELADRAEACATEQGAPEVRRVTARLAQRVNRARTATAIEEERLRLEELEAEADALEERVGARRAWQFPPEAEALTRARWWHARLDALLSGIAALHATGTGLASASGIDPRHGWSVPRRLAEARRLREEFAPGGGAMAAWEAALPSIRAAYPGLELEPQVGLVPLGADPDSGLWEFWDTQSGARPERDAAGHVRPSAESGLVLVLLPGGRFWRGAQAQDPEGRNFDARAEDNEGPVREVNLSPFFLSKFEVTQEVWERWTGETPSKWTSETLALRGDEALPVDQVSWSRAYEVLGRHGLTLPTEAQWEYASRAGSELPTPFADSDFAACANVADQAFQRAFAAAITFEPWDDGHARPAPVGSYRPNAFGLHDLFGNLWEWCLDEYDPTFYADADTTDPVREPSSDGPRICRGASFTSPAAQARASLRFAFSPDGAVNYLGVRAARPVCSGEVSW